MIAGYGRFGQMVGRILRANRIPRDDPRPRSRDGRRRCGRLGVKVYYGDASRIDLLHAAGCEHAKLFVLAVDDEEEATKIAENVRQHFPHLTILARCRDRQHYWELRKLGCIAGVPRDVRLGVRGRHRVADPGSATARTPRTGSRASGAITRSARSRSSGELWGTRGATSRSARRAMDEAERLMRDEDPTVYSERDAAWDNESLRAERVERAAEDPAAVSKVEPS